MCLTIKLYVAPYKLCVRQHKLGVVLYKLASHAK